MTSTSKFARITTAAVGAILISTACVAAAVGPATTAGQSPAAYAAVQTSPSVRAHA